MTKVKHIIDLLTKNYEPNEDIIFEFWSADCFPDLADKQDWSAVVHAYEYDTDEGTYLLERIGNFIEQLIYAHTNNGNNNDK